MNKTLIKRFQTGFVMLVFCLLMLCAGQTQAQDIFGKNGVTYAQIEAIIGDTANLFHLNQSEIVTGNTTTQGMLIIKDTIMLYNSDNGPGGTNATRIVKDSINASIFPIYFQFLSGEAIINVHNSTSGTGIGNGLYIATDPTSNDAWYLNRENGDLFFGTNNLAYVGLAPDTTMYIKGNATTNTTLSIGNLGATAKALELWYAANRYWQVGVGIDTSLNFYKNGSLKWSFTDSAHLVPSDNALRNIGSLALRIKGIFGTTLDISGASRFADDMSVADSIVSSGANNRIRVSFDGSNFGGLTNNGSNTILSTRTGTIIVGTTDAAQQWAVFSSSVLRGGTNRGQDLGSSGVRWGNTFLGNNVDVTWATNVDAGFIRGTGDTDITAIYARDGDGVRWYGYFSTLGVWTTSTTAP